jgi:predicted dinucleotide-binding enzyme
VIPRRLLLTGIGTSLAVIALATRARESPAETVAVLGTGRLGGAIGQRLAALGHSVVYGSRTPDSERVKALVKESGPHASAASLADAVSRSAIVVFALPWEPVSELLPGLPDLAGKLIIDPMNASPKLMDGYPFRADPSTSVAEQLQAWASGAHVVKAFNTILYSDLANPARAGGPISIPLAGADQSAKDRVASLVMQLGLDPVDTGPLLVARYLEDLLWFEVACIKHRKKLFEIYLRPIP